MEKVATQTAPAPYQNWVLRRARVSDARAIRDVAQRTWEATYAENVLPTNRQRVIASSYSDDSLRRSLKGAGRDNWFWVVEERPLGTVIGFAEVILRERDRYPSDAELTRIYVLPEWQRHGLGQALVEVLLADLRKLRHDLRPPRLYLAVAADNGRAISFYEARGFRHNRAFQANLPGQILAMQEYVLEI